MEERLSLGSKDALLARLWALATSPLEPLDVEAKSDEVEAFINSCVNPSSKAVNVDVVESILPTRWKEEYEHISNIVGREQEDVRKYQDSQDRARNASSEPGSHAEESALDEAALSTAEATEGLGLEAAQHADASLFDGAGRDDVLPSETDTGSEPALSTPEDKEKPQAAYILPVRVPDSATEGNDTSLAEMHYNIQAQPMIKLLSLNQKALTTDAYKEGVVEGRLAVTFGRIEELKRAEKWSLRQHKRFQDPERMPTHWDHLLSEAKFVRAGVQGDRRYKIAVCHSLSQAVLQYFKEKEETGNALIERPAGALSHEKYSLIDPEVPSIMSKDDFDRISRELIEHGIPDMPAFSFAQRSDDFANELGVIPISKFLVTPNAESDWRRIALEDIKEEIPAQKKEPVTGAVDREPKVKLSFKSKPESEIIPPPPPPQEYMSSRVGSAWQPSDDQKLLQLVKEFHNNWSLIAEILAHPDVPGIHANSGANPGAAAGSGTFGYTSNVQRRTPWQVFERWVQIANFDPKDLRGRTAEAARQWLDAASKAPQAAKKRQMTVSVAADSHLRGHQRLRWASMLEGIRKVKRKRETAPKPNNTGFLMRQRAEQTRPGNKRPLTAAELSRMKFEHDKQIADRYMHQRLAAQAQGRATTQPAQAQRIARAPNVAEPSPPPSAVGLSRSLQSGGRTLNSNGTPLGVGSVVAATPSPPGPLSQTSPPSIAGLPMPASVAAAARQQQALQAQQAQQAQAQQQMNGQQRAQMGLPNTPQSILQQGPITSSDSAGPGMVGPGMAGPGMAGQGMAGQRIAGGMQRRLTPHQQARLAAQQVQMQSQQMQAHQEAEPSQRSQSPQIGQQAATAGAARPRPAIPFTREQIQDIMARIAQNNPNLTPKEVQQAAIQNVRRYMQVQQAQRRATVNGEQNQQPSRFGTPIGSPGNDVSPPVGRQTPVSMRGSQPFDGHGSQNSNQGSPAP